MNDAPSTRSCPHCQHSGLAPTARFCDQCGGSLLGTPAPKLQQVGTGIAGEHVHIGRDVNISNRSAPADPAAQIQAYLRWLDRTQSGVRISNIIKGIVGTDEDPLQLPSVFVDLHTKLSIPEGKSLADYLRHQKEETAGSRRANRADPKRGWNPQAASQPEAELKLRPVTIFESLGTHPRLVLIGNPGSGKSTVGQFTTLALTRARLGHLQLMTRLGPTWTHGHFVPVPLVLRDFAAELPRDATRTCAKHVWEFLKRHLEACGQDPAWVEPLRRTASEQGVFFLLDGWDETHDPLRLALVAEAIVDLTRNTAPACRFLLTSRPYAWEAVQATVTPHSDGPTDGTDEVLKARVAASFHALRNAFPAGYEVAPLAPSQTQSFIDGWYRAVQEGNPPWFSAREAADKKKDLEIAAKRTDLQPVVSNPLLLTLTASLIATHLPDDRADLFNDIVELQLERWTARDGTSKSLRETLGRGIRHKDIRQKIQEAAFHAHGGCVGSPDVADIPEALLKAAFASLLGGSEDLGQKVVEFVATRTGLLLGKGLKHGQRQFACPHLTFQEFLAGCHLALTDAFTSIKLKTEPGETPSAVALAREYPEHWREVLCFAARVGGPERGSAAAHNLVHGQSFEEWICTQSPTRDDWRAAALAAKLLLEIGLDVLAASEITKTRVAHVAGWLAALVATGALESVRERLDAAIDLGRLGDPRPGVRLENGLLDIEDFIRLPTGGFHLAKTDTDAVIEAPFRLARYPVTVAQYASFITAGGYGDPDSPRPPWWSEEGWAWRLGTLETASWSSWEKDLYSQESFPIQGPRDGAPMFQHPNHPRTGISGYEAEAFCKWMTLQYEARLDGGKIALPTEAQWEWAARWDRTTGTAGFHAYPWGDSSREDLSLRCNWHETGFGHTTPVGLFPSGQAGCGAMDLSGNVWEWTSDQYQQGMPWRMLRGGSWANVGPEPLACGYRGLAHPLSRFGYLGFRCVWVGESAR